MLDLVLINAVHNMYVYNGTSFVSVEGRVQEIQLHTFTPVHHDHEKWFIS